MNQLRILFILLAVVLSGCFSLRIENRKHTNGLYVSVKKEKDHSIDKKSNEDFKQVDEIPTEDITLAPNEKQEEPPSQPELEPQTFASVNTNQANQKAIAEPARVPVITKNKKIVAGVINKIFAGDDKEPFSQKGETFGILAMVFGILSIPLLFIYLLGVVFAIPAIIFGVQGLKLNKGEANRVGRAFSRTGLICGIVALTLFLLLIILILAIIAAWGGF